MTTIYRGGDRRLYREITRQPPPYPATPLKPGTHLRKLTPQTRFDSGNYRPGHNQPALTLLAATATGRIPLLSHNAYAHELIATPGPSGWPLTSDQAQNWLDRHGPHPVYREEARQLLDLAVQTSAAPTHPDSNGDRS